MSVIAVWVAEWEGIVAAGAFIIAYLSGLSVT
jgi:hypothetical protein